MSELPSGTITFLFTDIEGSTKLWEEHPEEMKSALAKHDSILRAIFLLHSGYVFKTMGDAFYVAFASPSEALHSAIHAQQALQGETWGEAVIKVRMALHCGEVETRDNDYFGQPLNRVARLLSAGHGGQVLISAALKERLGDNLPALISLRDMGERSLKDLIRPEHIYQLVIANLISDFLPLKTLDIFRTNLPAQLTSFIGREKEIAEIKSELGSHRLVTLTGSGGTGKTRLSLQVAADLLDSFPGGVWYVELAPLSDPDLVPQTILAAFSLSQQAGRSALDVLKEYLHEKKTLIVLDNCEHLVAASAQAGNALLNTVQGLKILASSREALSVQGELAYSVPSLFLPDPKQLPAVEQLLQYEGVRLFVDRAMLVAPHFHMDKDNASFVAQICSRLDGIPLAIELAAARVKVLSVEQIAKRLDDRFLLLTGGARTALPRQQTLRALIDWSYNILSDHERLLLQRLSVFAGSWTLEAAEEVCSDQSSAIGEQPETPAHRLLMTEILELLTQLVNKSLVIVKEHSQSNETRYHMLETIRQYAREKMTEGGEVNTLRDRHLDYFLKLKEAAEPKLRSVQQLIWLNRLEAEHDNLRMAMEWSLGKDDAEVGLRFTGAGWFFWGMRGYSKEGARFLKATLEKPGAEKRSAVRAKALTGLAYMARYQGDLRASTNAALEGVEIWREVGDKWWLAFTLGRLGGNLLIQGDLSGARQIQEEAVKLAREADDKWALGDVLGNLCRVFKNSGDYQTARSIQEEGLAVYRKVGDKSCIAEALEGLGTLAHIQGDYEQAAVLYKEGLEVCREMHYVGALISLLIELGCIVQGRGDNEQAVMLFKETLVLAQDIGDKENPAYALAGLGGVAAAGGRPEQAALLLGASESILNALGIGIFSSYPQCLADYNRWLASTRSQLEEATFNKAWAGGAAMSMEEAIKYALEVTYE